jgi:hypothetical protein
MMGKKLLLTVLLFILLNGCTIPSGEKIFPKPEPEKETLPIETEMAKNLLLEAIETTNSKKTLRFSFEGYIANNIQKRRITNMYKGVFIGPDVLYVDASLMAQPYKYLQYKNKAYYYNQDKWWRANLDTESLNPMQGFTHWIPYLDHAVQLKEEKILNASCIPIQIKLRGDEWINNGTNPYFQEIQNNIKNQKDAESILKNSEVTTTIWISKKDHLLYQYKTIILLPVPSAGYMEQEIYFRFIKYNDPGIKAPRIEEIEKSITQ